MSGNLTQLHFSSYLPDAELISLHETSLLVNLLAILPMMRFS